MRQIAMMLVILVVVGTGQVLAASVIDDPSEVPRITVDELKADLDKPDVVIIDVRTPHDWNDSSTKIKGAIREEPNRLGAWMAKYPMDKTIVLYCN